MHTTAGVGYSKFVEFFRSCLTFLVPSLPLFATSVRSLVFLSLCKNLFPKADPIKCERLYQQTQKSFIHSFISTLHSIIIIIIIIIIVIMVVSPHCCLVLLYCCCVCCAVVVFVVQLQLFSGEEASQAGLTQCRLDVL